MGTVSSKEVSMFPNEDQRDKVTRYTGRNTTMIPKIVKDYFEIIYSLYI